MQRDFEGDPDWLTPQAVDQAAALHPGCYHDARFEALERRCVFARSWQLVAPAQQLSNVGDHVLAEIAGVPLLLVRGADAVLRALHNVCRHRAGPLAVCNGRATPQLKCRYHGWTYDLDGQLRGAPDMGRAQGFDVSAVRLPQARVAESNELVFACVDADAVDFADWIAALPPTRDGRLDFEARISYEVNCNWKVYVDNYLEGHHVRHVHPTLADVLDVPNYAVECGRWHVLQTSPLPSESAAYGSGEARYVWLWPNTMLNLLPGRLQTNRVLPLGPQRCRVDFDYYFGADVPSERRCADMAFSDQVQHEDVAICEAVQRGLASGSYAPGRLNPAHEGGLVLFQNLLRASYRAALGETGTSTEIVI